jgi:hypothetical protein
MLPAFAPVSGTEGYHVPTHAAIQSKNEGIKGLNEEIPREASIRVSANDAWQPEADNRRKYAPSST